MESNRGLIKKNPLGNNKKVFTCDLNETTIRDCIFSEVQDEKLKLFIKNPQSVINEDKLNCLNVGLLSCLKSHQLAQDDYSSEAEVILSQNEDQSWNIEQIDIIVNLNINDKELFKYINNCLKFFIISCKLPDTVNFYAINKYEVDSFQSYKKELENIEKEFDTISTVKKEKIKLYNIFNDL
jgi:hypothetical protein